MDLVREYSRLLDNAFAQALESGCGPAEVEAIKARAAALGKPTDAATRRAMDAFVDEIEALVARDDFPYDEPSGLDAIIAVRPTPLPGPAALPDETVLRDKMLGAWIGRIAGCMQGKPVESWAKERIEETLKAHKAWPLNDYFPYFHEQPKEAKDHLENLPPKDCFRGHITRGVTDDDTNYTILGLKVLEQKGRGFAPLDVAHAWLKWLPYLETYTAERAAYRNFINGLEPPESARYRNPFREWIGAQIRADIWGWVNPGDPATAAEYAWRDASISHTKNGIYGEMFFAAAMAQAFVTDDITEIIQTGLNAIPSKCRLAEAVKHMVEWCEGVKAADWETVHRQILDYCGDMNWVHTINNAMIVLMGLLLGRGDFTASISIAVMGGLDTDCNGATAGSIAGTVLGAAALPKNFAGPLNDTLESTVQGEYSNPISALAERTLAFALKKGN